ncbi:MAG: hypothetical protein JWP95_1887, partial [Actinotalea sp.]|nr:hypothetical protein [Actinotalea sp.]
MTQDYGTGLPSDQTSSTAQTAKDQAAGIAQSAAESGQHLAGEAKNQAAEIGREAGRQAKDILTQGRTQVATQASQQQQKLAGGIRTFGEELSTMAGASEQSGIASEVARQLSGRVDSVAGWLESREPADILEEVKAFARNRPGTFLLLAAGAGMLAGRLTRGLRDGTSDGTDESEFAGYRSPGELSAGYGLESTPASTTESAYATGAAYGTTADTGSYGTSTAAPTYGLEPDAAYSSATPTTQGSSDDTLAFTTASTEPYLGAP